MEPQPLLSPVGPQFHSISEKVKELVTCRGAGNSDSQKYQDEEVDSSDPGPCKGCRKHTEIPQAESIEKSIF